MGVWELVVVVGGICSAPVSHCSPARRAPKTQVDVDGWADEMEWQESNIWMGLQMVKRTAQPLLAARARESAVPTWHFHFAAALALCPYALSSRALPLISWCWKQVSCALALSHRRDLLLHLCAHHPFASLLHQRITKYDNNAVWSSSFSFCRHSGCFFFSPIFTSLLVPAQHKCHLSALFGNTGVWKSVREGGGEREEKERVGGWCLFVIFSALHLQIDCILMKFWCPLKIVNSLFKGEDRRRGAWCGNFYLGAFQVQQYIGSN